MNKIKELRAERGMLQSDLAKLLKIGQATISNWENGRTEPDQDSLLEMSKIFDASIDYILGNTDIKKALTSDEVNALPEAQALREVMESLSPEDRQRVLEFGRNLALTSQISKHPK